MGETLTIWSARVVVLFYALRLAIDFLVSDAGRRDLWARLAWTAGFSVYLLHVVLAFQFVHGWSHSAAVAHAARRTYEVTGLDWGGGIYINYIFTLLWGADVAGWWIRARQGKPTPAALYWTVHALFAFMMFNATVVFGPPFWKWYAACGAVLLVAARLVLPRSPKWKLSSSGPSGNVQC